MIYSFIAIFRRYASMLLVGTCFIFSSISLHSSSVTRNLICTFLFRLFIGEFLFCFHRGFGTFPKDLPQQALAYERTSKISIAGTADNRDFFTERGPLSYACYSTYPLIYITAEIHFFPKNAKKKGVASWTATLSSKV